MCVWEPPNSVVDKAVARHALHLWRGYVFVREGSLFESQYQVKVQPHRSFASLDLIFNLAIVVWQLLNRMNLFDINCFIV